MKILQFVCDGAPGGGTNHVFQLLSGLAPSYECALLTEGGSYLENKASEAGIEVFTGQFFKSRLDREAPQRLSQVIEEFQPDMIHCHGGRAAFYYSRIKKRLHSFYTVHGFHFNRKSILPRVLGWGGEYLSLRTCDNIVFVAEYDHQIAAQKKLLPKDKSFQVIHNGIAQPASRASTPKLGVGFVGRLVYQKHPQLFVEVMDRLKDYTGVMGGDGVLEGEISELVADRSLGNRLNLLGGLTHQQALDTIARLDVLVMTPRWEGLPLLPLEAMLLGVPVVSTPVGGIPEVIQHGENGLLGETAEELAEQVKRLMQDKPLRERIIENALRTAREEFSQQTMITKLENFYQKASAKLDMVELAQ